MAAERLRPEGHLPSASTASLPKAVATLQARAALAGWVVNVEQHGADGQATYTAQRWGQVRTLASVAELAAFLRQAGVPE